MKPFLTPKHQRTAVPKRFAAESLMALII